MVKKSLKFRIKTYRTCIQKIKLVRTQIQARGDLLMVFSSIWSGTATQAALITCIAIYTPIYTTGTYSEMSRIFLPICPLSPYHLFFLLYFIHFQILAGGLVPKFLGGGGGLPDMLHRLNMPLLVQQCVQYIYDVQCIQLPYLHIQIAYAKQFIVCVSKQLNVYTSRQNVPSS